MKGSSDLKRRLSTLVDLWNEIITMWDSGKKVDREKVVDMLKEAYNREKLSPLRGASVPEDLYERELISLYVVGRYGMGLDQQYPELFDALFPDFIRYEEAIRILLTEDPETARDRIKLLLGGLDDNTVARMLRVKMTEAYFGFSDHRALINLIKSLMKAFPEKERLAVKYTRFYIAFRVAEAIASGEVRDRISKEALKQALALETGIERGAIPDDRYIEKIAVEVFKVPRKVLGGILLVKEGRRRPRQSSRSG